MVTNSNLWYTGFLRECPSGQLKRTDLHEMYQQYFPFGDPIPFSDLLFDWFDVNGNDAITFKEFMVALSVSSKSSASEKAAWAFNFYDRDKDGFISNEEMLKVVEAVYKMIGNMIEYPEDEDTAEKRVGKIFSLMDEVRFFNCRTKMENCQRKSSKLVHSKIRKC